MEREIERAICCGFTFVFSRKSGATIIIYQIVFDLNIIFVGELNVEFTSSFKHSSCSVVCNFVAIFHLPVASNSEINLSSITCFRNFRIKVMGVNVIDWLLIKSRIYNLIRWTTKKRASFFPSLYSAKSQRTLCLMLQR